MAIKIDMAKPLIGVIVIHIKAKKVEYEGTPIVCYHSGKIGHLKEQCSQSTKGKKDNSGTGKKDDSGAGSNPTSFHQQSSSGLLDFSKERTSTSVMASNQSGEN